MNVSRKFGIYGSTVLVAGVAAVVTSCGGGDSGAPSAKQTTIDQAAVTKAVGDLAVVLPMCSGSTTLKSVNVGPAQTGFTFLAKGMTVLQTKPGQSGPALKALPPVQPPDELGDCGGRISFPGYSHVSGVTTATVSFENFCTYDLPTATKQIVNGTLSIVDTGTPGASGPITQKIEASSAAGITIDILDTADTLLASQKISFTGFVYTPGVPGGIPVAGSPDTFTVGELNFVDSVGTTYRQSNYQATYFVTNSGGEQMGISGRGYRSNGDYYDVSTTQDLVLDAAGNVVGGQLTVSGAAGSNAVATFVPGPAPLINLTVNGSPVPALPSCAF